MGHIFADTDGKLKFYSGSAWEDCNAVSDFGEVLPVVGERTDYEVGDVIVQSREEPMRVELSRQTYENRIIGVYSDRAGYELDMTKPVNHDKIVVGLIGLVRCKVTGEGGPIEPGDKLVTSSTPGYAMKASLEIARAWNIVGTAREFFNGDRGMIEILVGK